MPLSLIARIFMMMILSTELNISLHCKLVTTGGKLVCRMNKLNLDCDDLHQRSDEGQS